ncbi:MAG: PEP-CTERM sorting domain-containing protein [Planctomycetales bacterium]|nr:PEP-CTERM sorting domain-containing protein [Planctomycetales bacterium]
MTRWGKLGLTLCALALFSVGNIANADITIEVFPAFAPNGQGTTSAPPSPNWNAYVANALAGIEAGGVNTGTGPRDANPSYYETVSGVIPPSELIYTEFNSWRGTAANNPAFTGNAAVTGEYGNRIHFGTRITATPGMEFSLSDVSWSLDSDDDTDYFDQSGSLAGAPYSSTRIGINYVDGIKGNGDDIVINSGPGTQLVNELLYVGIGDGFPSENIAAPTDQDDINLTLGAIYAGCNGCEVMLTGSYTVGDTTGSGKVTIFIPEPSTMALSTFGVLACFAAFRKRR